MDQLNLEMLRMQLRKKTKESNTEKKKEEEYKCSDVKPDQNDRVYKQKKKGKLKANGGILLK